MTRIHKLWPSWLVLAALCAVFFGERTFVGSDGVRLGLAVTAAVLLAVALVMRLNDALSAGSDRRPVKMKLAMTTAGVAFALALYALIPLVFTTQSPFDDRMRGVLWAAWPACLVIFGFQLAAIELAVAPVAFIDRYEVSRVERSRLRALSLALFLSVLFVANYLANRHDAKWELSAGHVAVASDETRTVVRDLSSEVRVVLFFPRANEVGDAMERYFEPLAQESSKLTIERVDQALAGDLAKEAGVTDNGYVALFRDKKNDKIRLGTSAKSARSQLRRFDESFIKALVKISASKRVAYYTTGHDERALDTPEKEDQRPPLKLLKRMLENSQLTVRPLGLAQGLGDKVPEDADLVFILGPEKPFLPAEVEVLKAATAKGVRLLVALEAEREGDGLPELLAALGLKADKTVLANEVAFARATQTEADRWFIYSNKFSSHPSVSTAARFSTQMATVFYKSGSLDRTTEGALEGVKTDVVITAVDDTFRDLNGDRKFDAGTEKKDKYGLGAAITRTSTTGKREDEARVFVLSDVDVLRDDLMTLSKGNLVLISDVIMWLQRSPDPIVPSISEEDVKIMHRGEDDALLFYGTTFGVPLLVIVAGFIANRRRRRS